MELKILAVDDNTINLKLLSRTLTNNNFSVLTASCGKDAIEISAAEKPDLILLDVLMPEMDGYETCIFLKKNKDTKHIPIIFLSAKNETIDKARGLALGGSDYLTKPFDPVEIVARIRSHIAIRKDVIDLAHKNELLNKQLTELQNGNSSNKAVIEELNFLEKLKDIHYRETNKYFQINSRIKFSTLPATTIFIPAYLEKHNFIFLISGGFKKDYKTFFVQLMLKQYVAGFFSANREKSFDEKSLFTLFDSILDQFSPDIYDTAFTLSLSLVNAVKSEFLSLSIHQTPPVILDEKKTLFNYSPQSIIYESPYAKIINTFKIKLPPKATLFNYVSGKSYAKAEAISEMASHFAKKSTTINSVIENIFSSLPEKEDDQLVMAVKLL